MYDSHVPTISAYMRGSAEGFARGVMFAVCSIRQPIVKVPEQLADLDVNGSRSKWLFSHKRQAFEYIARHADTLWRDVLAAGSNAERIRILTRMPGLGIVKSGFVLQLMGYDVACLDSRNVEREKRDPRAFRAPYSLAKVRKYIRTTEGKARRYWDVWCAEVAADYSMTPHEVSALHLAIVPDTFVPF